VVDGCATIVFGLLPLEFASFLVDVVGFQWALWLARFRFKMK
jgi:hypothetical protein